MIPYELLQDLNKLACSSQDKRVENLFVKLAEEQDGRLHDWLLKNTNNKILKRNLNEQSVLDALVFLYESKNSTPPSGWVSFMIDKNPVYITIYGSFFRQLQSGMHDDLLSPLSLVLPNFSIAPERDWMTDTNVDKDLTTIHNTYRSFLQRENDKTFDDHPSTTKPKRRRSIKEKKMDFFSYLFRAFTEEISGAISGDPDMAGIYSVVRSGNLPNQKMLLKEFPFVPTGHFMDAIRESDKMLRAVVRQSRMNYDMAYNELRAEMRKELNLSFTTESVQEAEKTEEDFSRFLDVGYMPESEPHITNQLSFDKKTSSQLSYILLASSILNTLYQQAT